VECARPATESDVARVIELAGLLRDELRPMRGGEIWFRRDARPEPLDTAYAQLLADPDALVAVGCIDDVVLGFAAARVEPLRGGGTLGVLTELFVESDARSVGVGEALIDLVVDFCAGRGCVGVDAIALPGHRAAKNFFEGHGFTARSLVMHRALHERDPETT
jgi:GNAT superfamily N-acetyltransferase